MMNIGFDAKRAFHNASGLGNYSRQVIASLATLYPADSFMLYTPSVTSRFETAARNIRVRTPEGVWKFLPSMWRSAGLVKHLQHDGISVYHGLSNELPSGIHQSSVSSVVTIHDLIFLRYPQFYPRIDRSIYQKKTTMACRDADHIVAVSEQTKSDLIHFYRLPEEKISVIIQSISPAYFTSASDAEVAATRKKFSLPEKFLLSVGTIEERKNLASTVKAFSLIKNDADADLVVVGRDTAYRGQVDVDIEKFGLSSRVHFLKQVADSDLPALYQSATALLYPSRYEGFGLPIAEALASGTPVIAQDEAVFREAGGDATVFVNTVDGKAYADAILMLLTDEQRRRHMREAGKIHAERFRPEVQAGHLMKLYQQLVHQ